MLSGYCALNFFEPPLAHPQPQVKRDLSGLEAEALVKL